MTAIPTTPVTPSRFQGFWKSRPVAKLRRNKLAVIGLFITLLFFLTAIFAPLIAKPAGNCLRDLDMASPNQVYNPFGAPFWKAIFVPPASCYQTQRDSFSPIPVPPSSEAYLGTSNGYDIGIEQKLLGGRALIDVTYFSADLKDKIFSPFCTTKARGMGLGLPIVKRTVFDHNGRVDVDSNSHGTSVSVLLPVAENGA